MNINLDDVFVMSYIYEHKNRIYSGDWVIVGSVNVMKVAEKEWAGLNKTEGVDYVKISVRPATFNFSNALVEDVDAEPIFSRETGVA